MTIHLPHHYISNLRFHVHCFDTYNVIDHFPLAHVPVKVIRYLSLFALNEPAPLPEIVIAYLLTEVKSFKNFFRL